MSSWDPGAYLDFADQRCRPSRDLIERIPEMEPEVIWDLGCGTGDVTRLIAARWQGASTSGLDSSPGMLKEARRFPGIDWIERDIAAWEPSAPVDLIVATASLQWVPGHEALFPRLVAALRPSGVLAVQMPRNFAEPSHTLLAETAASPKWVRRRDHDTSP